MTKFYIQSGIKFIGREVATTCYHLTYLKINRSLFPVKHWCKIWPLLVACDRLPPVELELEIFVGRYEPCHERQIFSEISLDQQIFGYFGFMNQSDGYVGFLSFASARIAN